MKILSSVDSDDKYYFLRDDYVQAFKRSGAQLVPWFFDLDRLEELLDQVDGILIPGGKMDVDPAYYRAQSVHPQTKINRKRTEAEMRLIEAAMKRNLPTLGICFGFQILNVFFGGSLYQHLPDELHGALEHDQRSDIYTPCHRVQLDKHSRAHELFGASLIQVNSTHHQGVRDLGKGLVCQGKSDDTLVECFFHPEFNFVLGVEWHPERLKDDPVIPSFVKACQQKD